jgi:hypothetical protein
LPNNRTESATSQNTGGIDDGTSIGRRVVDAKLLEWLVGENHEGRRVGRRQRVGKRTRWSALLHRERDKEAKNNDEEAHTRVSL